MTKTIGMGILIFLAVLLVTLLVPVASLSQGQGQIKLTNSTAQMNFPLTLNFSAQVQSTADIRDVRLEYQVEQVTFAKVTSEGFVNLTPAKSLTAKYTLDMQKVGGLPPGVVVDYWWVVKDSAGGNLTTSPQKYQIADSRYKWQFITQGNVTLNWYSGSSDFAATLMKTAQDSLVQLKANTGATLSRMVNIYIYGSTADLQGAMIYPQEWTGGVAYTNFGVITIGIPTSQLTWGQGAMTHELTHQVIFQMTANPYNELPVWLNEGLAMYSEGPLDPVYVTLLNSALKNNSVYTVKTLSSPFSAYSDKANLSYAESYSFIDYLVAQYGSAKMLQLLQTFQQGSDYDPAFQTVYGFDMETLFNLWKPWATGRY